MRAPSRWLSHPRFKATWVALAAGSLAGLAVLGACSDSTVSQVAGLRAPEAPKFNGGVVGALSHRVQVCVHVDSDPAPGNVPYTFVGVAMSEAAPPNPWFERKMTDAEVAAEEDYVTNWLGFTSNSYGPFNAVTDNDVVTTNPSAVPGGPCADVFVRQNYCPNQDCSSGDPAQHTGNRMWTTPAGVQNKFATVGITANVPAGYTFTLTCANDDDGNPLNCVNGGYGSANVFHGSSFTYKFTAPEELPCPAGRFTFQIADGDADEAKWPAGGVGDLLIKYDQFPAPNDNSYGINAVGWDGGHTFGNLVGSDKAGVQLKNPGGTVVLSFNMDYISSTPRTAATPSGYASLGVNDGEGDMLVGTSDGISVTTSLANNLNKTGYCTLAATNFCTVAGTNLLVNSPPTDAAHQTYDIANMPAHGLWDFHNTYYARISAARLTQLGYNSSWSVEPNLTVLHNSPDKECPVAPPGPFSCNDITLGNKTFGSKEVKVDVNNINEDQNAVITGVHITWPAANGALKSVKVGGDVIWSGTIAGTSANLALGDLIADAAKRDIAKHNDADIKFTFANNVTQTLGLYTASLDFGDTCNKPILP